MLRVILIAHDGCKNSLVDWAHFNRFTLSDCELIATQSTGQAIRAATGLKVRLLLSGPQGGDAQAGALIATGQADLVVFFWDPLASQPHDVDVKTLIRLAIVHDIPIACNRTSADLLINGSYVRMAKYEAGLRSVPGAAIVGSVGRYRDFDIAFLPRQAQTKSRWLSIDQAMYDKRTLPTVELHVDTKKKKAHGRFQERRPGPGMRANRRQCARLSAPRAWASR